MKEYYKEHPRNPESYKGEKNGMYGKHKEWWSKDGKSVFVDSCPGEDWVRGRTTLKGVKKNISDEGMEKLKINGKKLGQWVKDNGPWNKKKGN
jgi:hypothetical protein